MVTDRLAWSTLVAVPWMKRKFSARYWVKPSGMGAKSLCCGNMESDMRARGHAGRQSAVEEALMMMTW